MSLPAGGTNLSAIPKHVIWVECYCGHAGPVDVAWVLEHRPAIRTVGQLVARVRCARCRARQVTGYRIVFEGNSLVAMRGADGGRGE